MDLRSLIPRRFRETRNHQTSLAHLLAPGMDMAGPVVTEQTIESIPAAARAINLIATSIARLPMRVTTDSPDGSSVEKSGPMAHLLNNWPCQVLHSFSWRQHLARTWVIHGNAYCYIQKSGRAKDNILQLIPLENGSVSIEWEHDELIYNHTELGRLSPSEVLHFRMPGGYHGIQGIGLLESGRETLSQMRSQQKVAASVAANTVQPRVVLKHPGRISEQVAAAAKSKFMQTFTGAGSGGTVLLQDGMTVDTLSVKANDLDFISTCVFSIGEVSRLTGVPLTLLSELSHSTFSNVVELNRSFIDSCLQQHIAMFSAEIKYKLLPSTRSLKFDTTALTRGTLGDQVDAWSKAIELGVITRNEMRVNLGMNPLDGLDEPTLRLDTAEVMRDETEEIMDA